MPKIEKLDLPRKRKMTVFFLLDTSGRMKGEKLAVLNFTMEEYVREIEKLKKEENIDVEILVMEINTGANLITENGPVKIEDFEWEYVKNGGLVDVGSGLNELRIQIEKYMKWTTEICWPVFVFMLTGWATDDYESALIKLKENIFFKRGLKIGVAIGDDVDKRIISDIVGNSEAVIHYTDMDLFRILFRAIEVPLDMIVEERKLDSYKNDIEISQILHTPESKAIIRFPGNDVTLYHGESYECAYCEVLPCDPENALIIALEIKYIDNGWGDEVLEVKNCCLENIYFKHIPLFKNSKVQLGDIISMNKNDILLYKKEIELLTFEVKRFESWQEVFENDDIW